MWSYGTNNLSIIPCIANDSRNAENNMKVVLIDPGFGPHSFNTFGQSHWSSVIHHGLCSISAYSKSKGFFNIELVDLRKLKGWNHFKEELEKKSPDVVGISMRSCDFNMVMKAVDVIKEINRKIVVVVGGVHPTVAPDEVATNDKIDYIITGEGEISFVKLLQDIEAGRSNGRIIVGVKPDLDELSFDDRELYDYHITLNLVNYPGIMKPPMVTLIASRGCPFDCTFCAPHSKIMFGKKVRFRSVDHVIDELKYLRDRYHFNSLKFYDYSFGLNVDWTEEFCEKYQANGFTAAILAQCRSDLIARNEQLLHRLKAIGLRMVIIGFESGSEKVLSFLRKRETVGDHLKSAELCKKYGILVVGNFMLGTPQETKEDALATLNIVRRIRPTFVSISYFTPVPGSYLYDYCQQHDLSLIKSYDELVTYAPSSPRIRGIDYDFLGHIADQMMGFGLGSQLFGKLAKFLYVKTKNVLWFRQILVFLWAKWQTLKTSKALK